MRYKLFLSEDQTQPLRLSVGHVIRCSAFSGGLRWKHAMQDPIVVAWRTQGYVESYIKNGKAVLADDLTRAKVNFLVFAISLVEAEGPEDVFPESFRFSRKVTCVRLADDLSFTSDSERISFTLNEPMSVAEPDESRIELIGFVQLPIFWEGGSQYA